MTCSDDVHLMYKCSPRDSVYIAQSLGIFQWYLEQVSHTPVISEILLGPGTGISNPMDSHVYLIKVIAVF